MKTYAELVLDTLEVEKDFFEPLTAFLVTYQPTIILAAKIGGSILGGLGVTTGLGLGLASLMKRRAVENVYKILQKEYNLSKEDLVELKKKIDKQVRQCVLKENVSPEECAKRIDIVKKNKRLSGLFEKLSKKFSGRTKNVAAAIATALGVALVVYLGKKYLKIDAPVYSLKFWKALVEYLKNPNGDKRIKALLLVSAGLALVGLAVLGYSGAKLLLKKIQKVRKEK